MREWTQSNLVPGNCWQTAVACILEVEPDALPDQVEIEVAGRSYHNALNAYLERHHQLVYAPLADFEWGAIAKLRGNGLHLMIGPTERTGTSGSHHVVVGRDGMAVWDPHPSRAGLLVVESWGVLSALPARVAASRARFTGELANEMRCKCRPCGAIRADGCLRMCPYPRGPHDLDCALQWARRDQADVPDQGKGQP